MNPRLLRFGASESPVVVIDAFTGDIERVRAIAAAMAPYPPGRNYYPGLRRLIGQRDSSAMAYVEDLLRSAATFIGGAFEIDLFDLLEASFSMVTADPGSLTPAQRAPHFDSVNPNYIAVLHYLSDTPGTGTAFYRQRTTDIERVDETNVDRFVAAAQRESAALRGYIQGSNPAFEQIGAVEAEPDRLVIYQGCLLHSGIIPPGMSFSEDPLEGRLTCNIFIMAH
ncbi:MAG TPA: DUF6445 family protein [Allosphingosinicella sp.]